MADFAGHVHVGQEMHFNFNDAVAFAGLAPTAAHIEAETPRLIAAQLRFRRLAVQFTNRRENAGIRHRIGTRRASDRLLVDIDNFVDIFRAGNAFIRAGTVVFTIQTVGQSFVKDLVDQRTLTRTGYSGHDRQATQGKRHINILQVVFTRAADHEFFAVAFAALRRYGNVTLTREVLSGQRLRRLQNGF